MPVLGGQADVGPSVVPNTPFYGDDLQVLRSWFASEAADLVYVDLPLNSARSYNLLCRQRSGEGLQVQNEEFDGAWTWSYVSEQEYMAMMQAPYPPALQKPIDLSMQTRGGCSPIRQRLW